MTFCSGSSLKPLNLWRNQTFSSSHQWTGCWPDFASCSFWDFSVGSDSEETRLSCLVSFLLHQSHKWALCFRGNGATRPVVRGTDERCEILLRWTGRWTVNTNTRQTKLRFPFCSILFCMFVLILMRWQWEVSLCFCSQISVQQPELHLQTRQFVWETGSRKINLNKKPNKTSSTPVGHPIKVSVAVYS